MADISSDLKRTPLYDLHVELGGKIVPFEGWAMPVQYAEGIKAEHEHTRAAASLFDVSHMGQVEFHGDGADAALETLVPGNLRALKEGRTRYTLLTTDKGGIIDDLMVTRMPDHLSAVVNAGRRHVDIPYLREQLSGRCELRERDDLALLALQGPAAVDVLEALAPGVAEMAFMSARKIAVAGIPCTVNRSGYTGEDGFEISVPAASAADLAHRLLENEAVRPAGLGARDSLRLEAGLCLYGDDIDESTTLVEAALEWVIGKRRREEGGFPGAEVILGQLRDGADRRRVGLLPEGRVIAREGTAIHAPGGDPIGGITSGGFGASHGGPVAMGYVQTGFAEPGQEVELMVRGRARPARIAELPFVAPRYARRRT